MSTVSRRFEVNRTPEITVRLSSGRVSVSEGPSDEVTVVVSGRLAERFVIEQNGPDIDIRMEQERRLSGSHDIEVVTPRGSGLTAQTAAADIVCTGRLGDVRIVSASGHVRADGIETADLKTVSGNISVAHLAGRLRARTASGNVEVESATDDVSVVTASGNVSVNDTTGDVSAKTASGRVDIDAFRGAMIGVKTVSGNVKVGIVPGRTVGLDLQSLTGAIRLPKEPTSGPAGGPELRVKVKTVTGGITVGVSG